jgi:hypothetical protein
MTNKIWIVPCIWALSEDQYIEPEFISVIADNEKMALERVKIILIERELAGIPKEDIEAEGIQFWTNIEYFYDDSTR